MIILILIILNQCLDNTNSNQADLYGCLKANYNEKTKKYECYQCKRNFMQVKNAKKMYKSSRKKFIIKLFRS